MITLNCIVCDTASEYEFLDADDKVTCIDCWEI
jgi:hypothetical protein